MLDLGQGFSVAALRDGAFPLPPAVLAASGAPNEPAEVPVFAFAIRWGAEAWLVDAGAGLCLDDGAGRLAGALSAASIAPSDVTRILLTHLHPDHVGGLVDAEGWPAFPQAEVVASRDEWTDWLSPEARAKHDENAAQVAAWAEAALGSCRLHLLDGPTALGHGVSALPAPGHRPGHMAYRLDASAKGVLFGGDLLHLPAWQAADPSRGLVWDADRGAAAVTRAGLLGLAADEGLVLAGAHLGTTGLARVARQGRGFALIAL